MSALGSESSLIACPLLVLALTHSPAKAGVAAFARMAACALCGLVAGMAADRFDRRYVMVVADGVRALAIGALGGGRVSIDHALGIADDLDGWLGLAIAGIAGLGGAAVLLATSWRPAPRDVSSAA